VRRYAELRIKIRSLADEQTTIRHSEERYRAAARILRKLERGEPIPPGRGPFKGHDRAALLARAEGTFWSLRRHRAELRAESRSAMLALAFLRGRPYATVESVSRTEPAWQRIQRLAVSFGGGGTDGGAEMAARWQAWQADAVAHFQRGLAVAEDSETSKR
jgi:hypothetical protein